MLYYTENDAVNEIGKLNFSGNIIPHMWYKTILKDNEKPDLHAIVILAEIIFWYRPKEIRDESSGELIGFKKRFHSDLLQKSYQSLADHFGISKRQATNAVVALEKLGVIERVFRDVQKSDQTFNNVLFIKINPDKIKEITYPEDLSSDERKEPLPPKTGTPSPKKQGCAFTENREILPENGETAPKKEESFHENGDTLPPKTGTPSPRKRGHPPPENGDTLPPKTGTPSHRKRGHPLTENGETYTEITTETTTQIYNNTNCKLFNSNVCGEVNKCDRCIIGDHESNIAGEKKGEILFEGFGSGDSG